MRGKTHLACGLFLCSFFPIGYLWFVVLFSSILADIDSSSSLLGRKVKWFGSVFEHRGFFHSLFFFVPMSIILYTLNRELSFAFTAGFGSHLLLDALTKQGIVLFPFGRIRGPFRTGKFFDHFLFLFFLVLFFLQL